MQLHLYRLFFDYRVSIKLDKILIAFIKINKMTDSIEIYEHETRFFADFKIGSIRLAVHLNIDHDIGVLDSGYAKQLLMKEPSSFLDGRVPLYICACCGDLGCGATTVLIEEFGDFFQWSEFGKESVWTESTGKIWQSEYMKRTGPFYFDKVDYKNAITPFLNTQRKY